MYIVITNKDNESWMCSTHFVINCFDDAYWSKMWVEKERQKRVELKFLLYAENVVKLKEMKKGEKLNG